LIFGLPGIAEIDWLAVARHLLFETFFPFYLVLMLKYRYEENNSLLYPVIFCSFESTQCMLLFRGNEPRSSHEINSLIFIDQRLAKG
jgi:hypothetical protein